MNKPEWLRRHLIDIGAWSLDGVGRSARARTCRCGATIMVGLDDDVAALRATTEPTCVTPEGELVALLAGRRTYRLRWCAGHYELDRRSAMDIAAQPAQSSTGAGQRLDVLVEHECGRDNLGQGIPFAFQENQAGRQLATSDPYTVPF